MEISGFLACMAMAIFSAFFECSEKSIGTNIHLKVLSFSGTINTLVGAVLATRFDVNPLFPGCFFCPITNKSASFIFNQCINF